MLDDQTLIRFNSMPFQRIGVCFEAVKMIFVPDHVHCKKCDFPVSQPDQMFHRGGFSAVGLVIDKADPVRPAGIIQHDNGNLGFFQFLHTGEVAGEKTDRVTAAFPDLFQHAPLSSAAVHDDGKVRTFRSDECRHSCNQLGMIFVHQRLFLRNDDADVENPFRPFVRGEVQFVDHRLNFLPELLADVRPVVDHP